MILLSEKDIDRFWSKVDRKDADSCWLWMASKNRRGYGRFLLKSHILQAHRVSWSIYYGAILDDLHVLHRCDTRACCNPEHLFLGTNLDNIRDRELKGRGKVPLPRGELNGRSKFTVGDIISIRNRHANGEAQDNIAKEYGVYQSAISKIVLRQRWAHV